MRLVEARQQVVRVATRALGICAADVLTEGISVLLMMAPVGASAAAMQFLEIGQESLILGFGLALSLELREVALFRRQVLGGRVAVALGATAAVAISGLLAPTGPALELGITASTSALRLHLWWKNSMVAIVALSFLSRRRGSREAEQRNLLTIHRLVQSRRRLADIGARTGEAWLEPEMIFECLERAREAYPLDRARGDAVLSRLAHCLRLAFDAASNVDSTVGRETELAAARLDVDRSDSEPPLEARIESQAAMARFPPGLLVRLTRDWARTSSADSPRGFRLEARQDRHALRIRLDGPCAVPAALHRDASDLLLAFAGNRARLRIEARSLHMEIAHA